GCRFRVQVTAPGLGRERGDPFSRTYNTGNDLPDSLTGNTPGPKYGTESLHDPAILRGNSAQHGTYCFKGLFRFRYVSGMLDDQLPCVDATGVEIERDGNGTIELAPNVFQRNARRCAHSWKRSGISAEDKWRQPGRSSLECRTEVEPRLLNHTIGHVSPKC